MTQRPFPAFSLSGTGIKHIVEELDYEVEDGNCG